MGHKFYGDMHIDDGVGKIYGYVTAGLKDGEVAGSKATIEGENNIASGSTAHAEGSGCQAIGDTSHAEGRNTKANGSCSHASGNETEAYGNAAFSCGVSTIADGEASFVGGKNAGAFGNGSVAFGYGDVNTLDKIDATTLNNYITFVNNKSQLPSESDIEQMKNIYQEIQKKIDYDNSSTALGESSFSVGRYSLAIGHGSVAFSGKAIGMYSFAFGSGEVYGASSLAFGSGVTIYGYQSIGLGAYHEITGQSSFSVGNGHTITGDMSSALCGHNTITGDKCFVVGGDNKITGDLSSVGGGKSNIIEGDESFAIGYYSRIYGDNSFCAGRQTIAIANEFVIGYANKQSTTPQAFVIGGAENASQRANAFRVTFNGDVYCAGKYNTVGADYAEYFEWKDKNINQEDRRCYFVTLIDDKITIASSNDYILGIVSTTASVCGNNPEDWSGRYIKDEFGTILTEEIEYEDIETDPNTGKEISIIKTGVFHKQNPNYDSTKPYVERNKRPEWAAIGMLGVLHVRDDGTCQVNGYCKVADGGIATTANNGYRVIARTGPNVIKIIFK